MGLSINVLSSSQLPLQRVAEEIVAMPEETGITVNNTSFKLLYLIEGEVEMRLDEGGHRYRLTPGDLVVLPKPCIQYYRPVRGKGERSHFLIFLFSPHQGEGAGRREFCDYLIRTFREPCHVKARSAFEVWLLTRRLREAMDAKAWWSHAVIHEIARQFVFQTAELAGFCTVTERPAVWERVRQEGLRIVRAVYDPRSFVPGKVATGQAPVFERYLGMSPARFANMVRIQRVKEQIVDSAQPLSVIAKRTGFSSLSTLSRTFRELAGMTPSDYRKGQHQRPGLEDEGWQPEVEASEVASGGWHAGSGKMVLCLSGSGELHSGSLRVTLSASGNTVLLAARGSRWKVTPGGDARLIAIPFERPGRRRGERRQSRLLVIREGERLEAIRLYWPHAGQSLHARLMLESLLRTLQVEGARLLEVESGRGTTQPGDATSVNRLPVDYAIEFIRKHYGRSLRLSEIAWFAGVSEEHLARMFRVVFGKSVMTYLKEYRIDRVKILLGRRGKSLAEIAESTGFGTAALLCRTFKRMEGMTPMEYLAKSGRASGG